MSTSKNKEKIERVVISRDNIPKLDTLIEQAKNKKLGLKLKRKDMVNFLIESHNDNLSPGEMAQLIDRFYDEIYVLRQLLTEANKAKKNGENFDLEAKFKSEKRPKRAVQKKEKKGGVPPVNTFSSLNLKG